MLIVAGDFRWGRHRNSCGGFLPGVGVLIVAGDFRWGRGRNNCWGFGVGGLIQGYFVRRESLQD